MLGVRRTSVTEVAIKMQTAGVIAYARGVIKILDLAKLKDISCECYETLHGEVSVQEGQMIGKNSMKCPSVPTV
jgi:hypothetical protein